MNKPRDYEEICVTVRNIPYQCEDEQHRERSITGGVLGKGRTVWVQSSLETKKSSFSAYGSAYVEGIGMVLVDPHYLIRSS